MIKLEHISSALLYCRHAFGFAETGISRMGYIVPVFVVRSCTKGEVVVGGGFGRAGGFV